MRARLRLLLGDRRSRQRGSILSSVLIIVAFLSILIGAVMTELTSSFLISRTLVSRMEREATVTSAVELGIHQLQSDAQNGVVPPNCARDTRGPRFVSMNNSPAVVLQTCAGIIPDKTIDLAGGAFVVDGVHDTTNGRDRYLVTDSSGRLYSYSFGQTSVGWSIPVGGPPTSAPFVFPNVADAPDATILVPVASRPGCTGPCVAVYDDSGGTPGFRCVLETSGSVNVSPAIETTSGGPQNFPGYVFIADSSGNLYVFADGAGCNMASPFSGLGGHAAGPPLVFQGAMNRQGHVTTISDEVFLLVTNGSGTSLQHWSYSESTDTTEPGEPPAVSFTRINSASLTGTVGGNAVGYAISSTVPSPGATLRLVAAGPSGSLEVARISVASGPSYSISTGPSKALQTAMTRPPSYCRCPVQDLVGAGGANGMLYLLDSNLNVLYSYAGTEAINTTPRADANGDWYFGADDGSVYDVEVPLAGPNLFMAAKFGPGGAIRSSPVVGTCASGPCLYFGSSTAGGYFVSLGATRILELRACVTSAPGSTICADNPQLWARVEVGSAAIVGGKGVYVQGWSYYSP
jgi:hypothetical protein